MSVLDDLRVLGEDDLRDLIDLYFSDVATQLTLITEALAGGDGATIGAAAHRIKGASLSIGAARVAASAAELEIAGRDGVLDSCEALRASIEIELEPTRAALADELSG